MSIHLDTETLEQALRRIWQTKWQHCRSGRCLLSQAEIAVEALKAVTSSPRLRVNEVKPADTRGVTANWYREGRAPATINKRLNCLSKLGVDVKGLRVKPRTSLKWWLKSEDYAEVCRILWEMHIEQKKDITPQGEARRLIRWTVHTGLRIEESLALRWGDIDQHHKTVTVPGLKTAKSQATLPLSTDAVGALSGTLTAMLFRSAPKDLVFQTTYEELRNVWQSLRVRMGWTKEPTCTLKALRRSAARYLHVECNMPLDMVRQYLRHEDIETTLGYLRLTGGYGTEEMRRFLK